MLTRYRTVRPVAAAIDAAGERVMNAYRGDRTSDEPDITGRLASAIEDAVSSMEINGVQWSSKTLRTGPGRYAEEGRHGADLLGVLNVSLPGFKEKKGFLIQAKKVEPRRRLSSSEYKRFAEQCETMLSRTSEAFVWLYSKEYGVRCISAVSAIGLRTRQPFDLYSRSLQNFYESHLESFIGDPRLHSPDIRALDALADLPVKHVLFLTAKAEAR